MERIKLFGNQRIKANIGFDAEKLGNLFLSSSYLKLEPTPCCHLTFWNAIKKVWYVIASEKRKIMKFELFKKKHPSEQPTNKSKWKIDMSSTMQAPYYSIIDVSERYL